MAKKKVKAKTKAISVSRPSRKAKGVEEFTFKGWRHAFRLANKHAEVVVVPAVGRILSYRLTNGENVLNINEPNAGMVPPTGHKGIVQFGGVYTWLAPQAHWTDPSMDRLDAGNPGYEVDFGPYEVTRTDSGELTMTSPVSPTYGLKVEKNLRLANNSARLTFTVTLHNTGVQRVRWAVWNLSAVKPTGIAFFELPHGEADLNFFGNPQVHTQAYSNITHIIDDHLAAVDFRDYRRPGAKLFVRVGSPYLAYRQPGSWFLRTFSADPSQIYTDQQSQIELWADAQAGVFELEVASPDYVILPGKRVSWTESMDIVPDAEKLSDDPFHQVSKLKTILEQTKV